MSFRRLAGKAHRLAFYEGGEVDDNMSRTD